LRGFFRVFPSGE